MHFSKIKHKVQKLCMSLSIGHTLGSALGQTALDFPVFFQKYFTIFQICFRTGVPDCISGTLLEFFLGVKL